MCRHFWIFCQHRLHGLAALFEVKMFNRCALRPCGIPSIGFDQPSLISWGWNVPENWNPHAALKDMVWFMHIFTAFTTVRRRRPAARALKSPLVPPCPEHIIPHAGTHGSHGSHSKASYANALINLESGLCFFHPLSPFSLQVIFINYFDGWVCKQLSSFGGSEPNISVLNQQSR